MKIILCLVLLACAGCTSVAPYQRGYLALPAMAFEPSAGLGKALEKTYAAKEAASGGGAVGGGGCGCN